MRILHQPRKEGKAMPLGGESLQGFGRSLEEKNLPHSKKKGGDIMTEGKEVIVEIPEGFTEDDMNEALSLLVTTRKRQESYKTKLAEKKASDPNYAATLKEKSQRYMAKQRILLRKAQEAGVSVTDEEVDAYMKTKEE
jgi:FKBP-type peptidyl-prolyl cis-trans isomerase (trigger factor)